MDSQSGRILPIIYQPFDGLKRSHWGDRGSLYDFLYATRGEGKRPLDFGPGDGWPSLIVAPFAAEVVGVDSSQRRVEVCAENATRLGLANSHFQCVAPGSALPYVDNSFDGVMAASSVEQSPDPRRTLQELHRVLKPGGCLRMNYESFSRDRHCQEHECWLWPLDAQHCRLVLFDRDIAAERAVQYGITFAFPAGEFGQLLAKTTAEVTFDDITIPLLEKIRPAVIDARVCTTIHASGRTLVGWLGEIGFRQIVPSHDGGDFAANLFSTMEGGHRPQTLAEIDALLRPIIKVVVEMPAPLEIDPPITAVK